MSSHNKEKARQGYEYASVPRKAKEAPSFKVKDCKRFETGRISKEELNDYLDFCRHIFPNKDTNLGLIFTEDLHTERALNFLHDNNYNVTKTKFSLLFPSFVKIIDSKGLNIVYSESDMRTAIAEYFDQRLNGHSHKEQEFQKRIRRLLSAPDKHNLKEIDSAV